MSGAIGSAVLGPSEALKQLPSAARLRTDHFEFHVVSTNRFSFRASRPEIVLVLAFGYVDGHLVDERGKRQTFRARPYNFVVKRSEVIASLKVEASTNDVLLVSLNGEGAADLSSAVNRCRAGPPRMGWYSGNTLIKELGKRIRIALLGDRQKSPPLLETCTSLVFMEAIQLACTEAVRTRRKKALNARKLESVIEYVEANLDKGISVVDLAEVAGMSVHTFARSFKSQTGQTPYQFIIDQRVRLARTLLTSTNESILNVAYRCGFSSQSHMTSVFRRLLGVTPAKLSSVRY